MGETPYCLRSEEAERDVALARSGSRAAFERLYVELRPRVRHAAWRVTRDEHEAEDTAQDAFMDAFRCLPRLADPEAFEAWLMKITKNRAVDRRRRMLRCRPSERAHDDGSDRDPMKPRVVMRSGVAEAPPETIAAFRDVIADMAPSMRDALRLRYMRGLTYEEIARRKGVSIMAVKTRLFRARRRLRAALSSSGEPAFEPEATEKTCVSVRGG